MKDSVEVQPATPGDIPQLLAFIKELALYEKEPEAVVADEADLERALFSADRVAHALVAKTGDTSLGFALYFYNYSTWTGRKGLYLEDLFVSLSARKQGVGFRLLRELARIAVREGCGRFEWSVLDWNQPAIDFYTKLGARPMDGWSVYRLQGEALRALSEAE